MGKQRKDLAKKYFGNVPFYHHGNMGMINLIKRIQENIDSGETENVKEILSDIKDVLANDEVKKQVILMDMKIEAMNRLRGETKKHRDNN